MKWCNFLVMCIALIVVAVSAKYHGDVDGPADIVITEVERVRLHNEQFGEEWPLPEMLERETASYTAAMADREQEAMQEMDAQLRWDLWTAIAQARLIPNLTETQYKVVRVPEEIHAKLYARFHEQLSSATDEAVSHSVVDGPTLPKFFEQEQLNYEVLDDLLAIHESWAQVDLEPTSAYGIRVYQQGNTLVDHLDVLESHVISGILHIDSDLDEPFPIEIQDARGVYAQMHRRARNKVKRYLEKGGHALTCELVEAGFSEEKYTLYEIFQRTVHKQEDITQESFSSFLCRSPLVRQPTRNEGDHSFGLGTAHIEYRLDGELVGVSVVDLLPRSINACYFFWDKQKWGHLNLGTWTALYEISIVQSTPNMMYWFPGWYVHTCPQMNYKAKFRPSQLLCPETHRWVPFDSRVRAILDEKGFGRLDPDESQPKNPPARAPENLALACFKIGDLYMGYNEARMLYGTGRYAFGIERELISLVSLMGREISSRVCLEIDTKYVT